ncbi:two-component system sensor histidine kinase ChvG [Nitrospirillum amazonense]|uniref:histidine kinase n=1 Tax=Nitrospirillum amazonense TaxID=28077 RepID=A0A560FLC4_9PROT|nr:stimulus-sensing domain-containing protein [Nitrospirillum amazonense]TWB22419.1 two-component system sensor histidine kinase ChvG [Nitrospirillum amazonense]
MLKDMLARRAAPAGGTATAQEMGAAPLRRGPQAEADGDAKPVVRARRRRSYGVISPLTRHILTVNLLALALLLSGLLYLERYQDWLVQRQLDILTTEARIFSGALGEGAMEPSSDEFNEPAGTLSWTLAAQMVRRLGDTTDTRFRLYDPKGKLQADSRVLSLAKGTRVQIEELPPLPDGNQLTQLGIDLYNAIVRALPTRDHLPVYAENRAADGSHFPDVQKALNGEAATHVWRVAGDAGKQDMVLTVAVPIQRYKQVLGAVLISRSGSEIDTEVREFRVNILKVFGGVIVLTVLMSIYLASTIVRPIRRLAAAADDVRYGHGRQAVLPDFSGRHDEIGDLSQSLRAMTSALWDRMDAIERFAADVAHEIKNPLTSMRSAVETVQLVKDETRLRKLLAIIADDVGRLDRLISDISNASRLDAELSRAEANSVDLRRMLTMFKDIHENTLGARDGDGDDDAPPPVTVEVELPPASRNLVVPGIEGRLTQVFQNLISNALSFSPPGGKVVLAAKVVGDRVEITCTDDGPGIPAGKTEAIFDRFYTERPAGEKFGTHSGLGLSISKQIVEAHNGRIFAANRTDATGKVLGAVFTVQLPRG